MVTYTLGYCDAWCRDRFTDKVCRPTLKRKYVEKWKTYLAYHFEPRSLIFYYEFKLNGTENDDKGHTKEQG